MPPRKFGEGAAIPAEDFGYQFLVGFGAQSPPSPATRRETQHNCLLIRIIPPMVTRFLADTATQTGSAGTTPCTFRKKHNRQSRGDRNPNLVCRGAAGSSGSRRA